MASRSYAHRKKAVESTPAAPQNDLLARPFAPHSHSAVNQTIADQSAQSERVSSYGHSLANCKLVPSAPVAPPIQPKLTVGAPGDPYEQKADYMAQQVVQRLQASQPLHSRQEQPQPLLASQGEPPAATNQQQQQPLLQRQTDGEAVAATTDLEVAIQASRGSGHPLDDSIRQPMEQAFGNVDFSGVNVHTDAQSDRLNRSIQANAFTTKQDIFFRQGAYDPGSRGGQALLAHELTHVVQQTSAATSSNSAISGSGEIVQRALAGSYAAIAAVKGEKGFRAFKTHGSWTDMLQALRTYETLESKPFPSGKLSKQDARRAELRKGLGEIEKYAKKWLTKHEASLAAATQTEAVHKYGDSSSLTPEDQHGLEVLSQVRNLLRRVAWEKSQINAGALHTPNQSDSTLTGQAVDNAVGGQASKLDQVSYTDGTTATTGYYQPDATMSPVSDNAAGAIGIPGFDPNYAGRSMAMARIDQLLTERLTKVAGTAQSGLLVSMNFATHTREPQNAPNTQVATMGVYLEKAKGGRMREEIIDGEHAIGVETARTNQAQVALDDPVLQRALNKLQLLDAVCGQVDRHGGNYFVETDNTTGKVTGVQGIDNDMAFGEKMTGDKYTLRAQSNASVANDMPQRAWKGLPPIADAEMASAIQTLTAHDIQAALEGLITQSEIDATLSRLESTQAFLQTLSPSLFVKPGEWDTRRQELANKQQVHNSYLGDARKEALLKQKVLTTAPKAIETLLEKAMEAANPPKITHRMIRAGAVIEYIFGYEQIKKDIDNLIVKGDSEKNAIERGKALAANYAAMVKLPNIDRSKMNYKQAEATLNVTQCAAALESARRAMYALWQ